MLKLVHKKYVLPVGCNCKEVILRETNGVDEQQAARLADIRGDASSLAAELVRRSIVSVDGDLAVQPFTQFDEWNTKTRNVVLKCYERLNTLSEEELAFLELNSSDLTEEELEKMSSQSKD